MDNTREKLEKAIQHYKCERDGAIVVLDSGFGRTKSSRREQSPGLIFFQNYVFSTGGSKDYGRKPYAPMLPTPCCTTSFLGSSYVGKHRGANKQKSNIDLEVYKWQETHWMISITICLHSWKS